MRMHCHKRMEPHRFPLFPRILFATSLTVMAAGTIASLWLAERMLRTLETMAMTKTLAELHDRLSDVERADLEGQIRERLFPG